MKTDQWVLRNYAKNVNYREKDFVRLTSVWLFVLSSDKFKERHEKYRGEVSFNHEQVKYHCFKPWIS